MHLDAIDEHQNSSEGILGTWAAAMAGAAITQACNGLYDNLLQRSEILSELIDTWID
jgi:hypothetical protein